MRSAARSSTGSRVPAISSRCSASCTRSPEPVPGFPFRSDRKSPVTSGRTGVITPPAGGISGMDLSTVSGARRRCKANLCYRVGHVHSGGAGDPQWRGARRPSLQYRPENPAGRVSVRTVPLPRRPTYPPGADEIVSGPGMPMPIVSDLDAAMLQPARSVPAVRRLGGGLIRMNDAGQPVRVVGRDAVIYELRTPTGRILVLRCFLRPDAQRDRALAQRYEALRGDPRLEHLRGASGALPRDIQWIAEGVAFAGPDLRQVTAPLVAMERVPGRTLMQTVDRLCREEQGQPLALLADVWLATATVLEDAAFVHGD